MLRKPSIWMAFFFFFLGLKRDMMKNSKAIDEKVVPFIAAGLMIGVLVGIVNDNIGLWISLGLAFGAGVGYTRIEKK